METAIMKSLLNIFLDEVNLRSDQLTEAKAFVFNQADTITLINDSETIDTLTYLKELVEENSFTQLNELELYFTEKKKRYGKFLWDVISDENKSDGSETKGDQDVSDKLNIMMSGSFTCETLLYPELKAKNFDQYLRELSIYFRKLLGRSLRNKISHHQEFRMNLDSCTYKYKSLRNDLCLPSKRKLYRYFEKFSEPENKNEVIVWTSKVNYENNVCDLKFIDESHIPNYPGVMLNTSIEPVQDGISKIYDNIVRHVQQEIPILDEGLKEEFVEWLCYSKAYTTELISWKEASFNQVGSNNHIESQQEYDQTKDDSIGKSKAIYKAMLSQKKWKILKSPPGHTWLTSDNPGFGINLSDLYNSPSELTADASLSHIRPDTLIYYPLSSDYCLRIQPNTDENENYNTSHKSPIEFEESSFEEFEIVNGLTFSTKNQMVLGKDKKSLERLELI